MCVCYCVRERERKREKSQGLRVRDSVHKSVRNSADPSGLRGHIVSLNSIEFSHDVVVSHHSLASPSFKTFGLKLLRCNTTHKNISASTYLLVLIVIFYNNIISAIG